MTRKNRTMQTPTRNSTSSWRQTQFNIIQQVVQVLKFRNQRSHQNGSERHQPYLPDHAVRENQRSH